MEKVDQVINQHRLDNLTKNVPAEMKAMPHWCVLNLVKNDETGTYQKFIVNANNTEGNRASHKDSTTWTTFDKALEYAQANNGAGLAFAILDSGINVLDIDHCYDQVTETYNEIAQKYLTALPNSYAERSVSGMGLHILTKGTVCENNNYNEAWCDQTGLDVLDTFDFISMTGDLIDEQHKDLVVLSDNVKKEIRKQMSEPQKSTETLIYFSSISKAKGE